MRASHCSGAGLGPGYDLGSRVMRAEAGEEPTTA